jgi:hypothetical protein
VTFDVAAYEGWWVRVQAARTRGDRRLINELEAERRTLVGEHTVAEVHALLQRHRGEGQ